MFLKFISSHILEYRRLRIELDLIDSSLGNKYPIVKIITKHLRDPLCDTKQLEEEIEEYYGTSKSEDNTNSS